MTWILGYFSEELLWLIEQLIDGMVHPKTNMFETHQLDLWFNVGVVSSKYLAKGEGQTPSYQMRGDLRGDLPHVPMLEQLAVDYLAEGA